MNSVGLPARAAGEELRVLHCAGFYFPATTGGTEVYVRDLAEGLRKYGVASSVCASAPVAAAYVWQGVPVVRYPLSFTDELVPSRSPGARPLTRFQHLVLEARPDLFHLHSWTTGAGLAHLEQAAALGIPCVVTVHVPSVLCLRGTMMLNGRTPCDGLIDDRRCAECYALARGLPGPAAWAIGQFPNWDMRRNRLLSRWPKVASTLSLRQRVVQMADELHRMDDLSARIVAPSDWVSDALARNGIDRGKIVLSRQVASDVFTGAPRVDVRRDGSVTIGFIGRLEEYKGPDVLVSAMAGVPKDVPVRLRIAGSGTDERYARRLARQAGADARIELVGHLDHHLVPDFLRSLHVLAVPSRSMETGPIVVHEAQALGLPIMGADIGGIAERVRPGVDGWLMASHDIAAWTAAIVEAASDRRKLARLADGSRAKRTVDDVAREMDVLYREVLSTIPAAGAQAGARA
ncbi:glycosyltransferase [Reyranella sp.]|uniref:glycosyltransferase n=1 Tax=Reyranella sp. TaxID=1929291 RepID=UPI003BAC44BC